MLKPLLYALLAAIGNGLFVYGQRGSPQGANPFLFTLGAVVVCTAMCAIAALVYRTPSDAAYVADNARNIVLGGIGFFITFVGFFLLYTSYGASQYVLYAVLAILTTTVGVGVIIFREPFNIYQTVATLLAVGAIVLFTYGRSKGAG